MKTASRPAGTTAVDGADDGRRRRRRSATRSGAFAGKPAALVDDLTLPAARRGGAPGRPAADHRRGGLGQDPGADPAHRAPAGDGGRAALGRPRHHLHQQGGRRDAHARGRPGRSARREDVGLDLPLGLPAHPAHERRPAGLPLRLHRLRRHRLAPPHRDDHGRARLRPEAPALAGRAGGDQPGQVRAGGLRDVPRGGAQRARPVPQAHRRRLHASTRSGCSRRTRSTSTTC